MNFINNLSYLADKNFVRQSMNMPMLDPEQEMVLAKAWHDCSDVKAMHKLTSAYTRLVISIAVRYRHYGISMSDLIQEGVVGLLHAAERFDPDREVRFSSYAKWWVRAYIQNYILRNWSIVRTGSTTAQKALFFNLNRLKKQLTNLSNDMLDKNGQAKIAELLHVTMADVASMEGRLLGHDLSLSAPINDQQEDDWQSLLQDESPNPEEASVRDHDDRVSHTWVEKALKALSPRERQIISQRRLSDSPKTLEQIGKDMGITKERVRQLEAKAMRKLKFYFFDHLDEVKHILQVDHV